MSGLLQESIALLNKLIIYLLNLFRYMNDRDNLRSERAEKKRQKKADRQRKREERIEERTDKRVKKKVGKYKETFELLEILLALLNLPTMKFNDFIVYTSRQGIIMKLFITRKY